MDKKIILNVIFGYVLVVVSANFISTIYSLTSSNFQNNGNFHGMLTQSTTTPWYGALALTVYFLFLAAIATIIILNIVLAFGNPSDKKRAVVSFVNIGLLLGMIVVICVMRAILPLNGQSLLTLTNSAYKGGDWSWYQSYVRGALFATPFIYLAILTAFTSAPTFAKHCANRKAKKAAAPVAAAPAPAPVAPAPAPAKPEKKK